MHLADKPKRFGHHNNGFGALRLAFASMVILSHTPELIDGNRDREILTNIFSTLSFGEFAVNCFFILSGYLICSSYLNSSSTLSYIKKRSARIYPGFVIVSLICIFVVSPLGGGNVPITLSQLGRVLHDCFLLQKPSGEGAFIGRPYPSLDGSLWTIAYEFRCYLLIAALGLMGALNKRYWLLALTIVSMALATAFPMADYQVWQPATSAPPSDFTNYSFSDLKHAVVGDVRQGLRLAAVFLSGACAYIFRDFIKFSWPGIVLTAIALSACLCFKQLALPGMMIFGSYLIFAIAKFGADGVLSAINNENDVSYGIYLYAWPITKLLDWWFPNATLAFLIVATFALACACGWLSWLLIEKPAMKIFRSRKKAVAAA